MHVASGGAFVVGSAGVVARSKSRLVEAHRQEAHCVLLPTKEAT